MTDGINTRALPGALVKPGLPGMERLLLRVLVILAFLVALAAPYLDRLAVDLEQCFPIVAQPVNTVPKARIRAIVPVQYQIAQAIVRVTRPPGRRLVTLLGCGGMLVMAGELLLAARRLVCYRRYWTQLRPYYMRIRPLRPQSRVTPTNPTPENLWQALHALHTHMALQDSPRPWYALTLSTRPEEAATLGALVPILATGAHTNAGARSCGVQGAILADRPGLARALESVLLGQDSEVVVDTPPDPLAVALQPGRYLLWEELSLARSAHFPIRFQERMDSDLMGGLAAALRTAPGVAYLEIQLAVQPRRDTAANVSWRVHARRRLVDLRKKAAWSISTESTLLEAKTDSEAFDCSLRLLAIADDRAAGKAVLREVRAAFGQYQQRGGVGVQRFVPTPWGTGQFQQPAQPWSLLVVLSGLLACLTGAASTWVLPGVELGRATQPTLIIMAVLLSLITLWGALIIQRTALLPMQLRAPRIPFPMRLVLPFSLWRGPMILGIAEAAGLWHLPRINLRTLITWLPNRYLPAPQHAFVHEPEQQVIFGYARTRDGQEQPVGAELRALRQVLHITAGMGAGKSRALANITEQLIQRLRTGVLLLDGKGDDAGCLAATVRTYIPQVDEARLMLIDLLDADWPIGLNPFYGIDLHRAGGATQALGVVMALLARLDPELSRRSMGMVQYLQMGTMLIIEGETAPTFASLKQCLEDEHYRQRLLPSCTNIEVVNFWTNTFPQTSEQQKNSLNALLRRFDNLLVDETTRYLLTQPVPTIDFLQAIESGAIVLAPMPHRTLGGMTEFAGMLLLQAIVRAAFQRPGSDMTRSTVPLIIDELQVFIGAGDSTDIRDALTQLRGFGIAGIYAHQSLFQLGDLKDEMLTNSASRLILRTQEPDASTYARQYPMTDLTAADIAGQHAEEHQYAVIAGRASAPEPFSIRPRLWPAALEVDHSLPSCLPTDWQTILPAGADALDRLILRLVYGAIELMPVAAQLAVLPDEEWHLLLMRWNAIRACQRAYIVEHPACIPDRLERQTWLSRLWIATPRVLAAAVYQRQRWQIDPTEPQHAVLPRKQANRGYRDPSAPAAPAIIPGAAAPASTAGITAAGPTLADAMARRAQRAPAEERSVGKEYGA